MVCSIEKITQWMDLLMLWSRSDESEQTKRPLNLRLSQRALVLRLASSLTNKTVFQRTISLITNYLLLEKGEPWKIPCIFHVKLLGTKQRSGNDNSEFWVSWLYLTMSLKWNIAKLNWGLPLLPAWWYCFALPLYAEVKNVKFNVGTAIG